MLEVEDAIHALREAVKERGPNYCYPVVEDDPPASCHYKWTPEDADRVKGAVVGKPACGVGLALAKRGILDTLVPSHTAVNNARSINGMFGVHHHISGRAIEVLSAFQTMQDRGTPWGLALDNAENHYARLTGYSTTRYSTTLG